MPKAVTPKYRTIRIGKGKHCRTVQVAIVPKRHRGRQAAGTAPSPQGT